LQSVKDYLAGQNIILKSIIVTTSNHYQIIEADNAEWKGPVFLFSMKG